MDKPVHVLHVFGGLSLGGAESRIMDLYRKMDREKVQFDFLVHSADFPGRTPEFFDEEIKALGGRIFVLPKFRVYNFLSYRRAVRDFFTLEHDFAVVQGHMTSTASIYLQEAKKAGILIAAAHARSAGVDPGVKGLVTKLLRKSLIKKADYCLACSAEAGRAVYGKRWETSLKALVIPNAIDAPKYRFNEEMRQKLREELNLSGCLVIGHVGRFHYAKNHEYLIEICRCLKEKANGLKIRLLLAGAGDRLEVIREMAAGYGLEIEVIFLGNRPDIHRYYQAMDFFVFPSRFEGLPGTVMEAQAAGLRCLISDRITPEARICSLAEFESIDNPPGIWADYILKHIDYERKDMLAVVKEAGFDVESQAAVMEAFYLKREV